MKKTISIALFLAFFIHAFTQQQANVLEPIDVFDLEFASDPQIAPDGSKVVYVPQF